MTSRMVCWCVLLGALASCERSKSESLDQPPKPAVAPRAEKELGQASRAWLDIMRKQLPGAFCKDEMYFRQCFDVTAAECQALVSKHFEPCLAEHPEAVPRIVNADTGRAGGQVLGACVGSRYDLELQRAGKRKSSERCNNAANWTQ